MLLLCLLQPSLGLSSPHMCTVGKSLPPCFLHGEVGAINKGNSSSSSALTLATWLRQTSISTHADVANKESMGSPQICGLSHLVCAVQEE